jgi:hypothetical protein
MEKLQGIASNLLLQYQLEQGVGWCVALVIYLEEASAVEAQDLLPSSTTTMQQKQQEDYP